MTVFSGDSGGFSGFIGGVVSGLLMVNGFEIRGDDLYDEFLRNLRNLLRLDFGSIVTLNMSFDCRLS